MKKNTWVQVEGRPNIFVGQYIVPNFMSNSIAIEVTQEEWIVISPGKSLLSDWSRICPKNSVKLNIVMPNGYHYLGVEAWLDRFPNAELFASQKAITMLGQKLKTVIDKHQSEKEALTIQSLEQCLPSLPDNIHVLIPPGHRGGDVWFSCGSQELGPLWIICDSFQNYERLSNQPIARLLQRLFDTAPGLKMSRFVKWLLIDDKRAFREWVLKKLVDEKPTGLIPSHGEVENNVDLWRKLEGVVKVRL